MAVTLVVGDAGAVAPVHTYTSYELALAAAGQLSVADVWAATVEPSAGEELTTQAGAGGGGGGGTAAVVKVVLLVEPQPVAGPVAFFGTIYQLYKVEAVKPVTL